MLQRVKQYIEKYEMLDHKDTVIVGVSGGADSVCLLFMLRELQEELGISLRAVHVEHGIRGEESLEDAKFVKELCRQWEIPLSVYSYPVEEIAAQRKLSVEEAGREMRYQSFYEELHKYGAGKIATAHHQDDQCETVLMNLSRGTGLTGAGGIRPVRDQVIRPLLCLGRQDIEQYLKEQNVPWRTDQSNLDTVYTRNRVRLELVPLLKQGINSEAVSHIARSAELLREADDFVREELRKQSVSAVTESRTGRQIHKAAFTALAPFLQKMLVLEELKHIAGREQDFGMIHVEDFLKLLHNQVGRRIHLPYGITAVRNYDGILLTRQGACGQAPQEECYQVPEQGEIVLNDGRRLVTEVLIRNSDQEIPQNKYTKWFDYGIIRGNLQFRTKRQGDFLTINKTGGRKKLKSYFIDQKIPAEERGRMLLLAEGNHILWIPGYRISESYKVTEQTNKIWKVRIDGGDDNGR